MQRRALLQFAFALLLIWMGAVPAVSQQYSASSPLMATEKDDGKTLELKVGQFVVIQLPSSPSTGYRWVPPWDLGPLVGGRQKQDVDGRDTETFKFQARETGTATLIIDYKVPTQNDPPVRTFTVTVNVAKCEKCECKCN